MHELMSEDALLRTALHEEDRSRSLSFFAFNTFVELRVSPSPALTDADLEEALLDAQRSCERFEDLFSRTRTRSDIGRINAAHGALTSVDEETATLVEAALHYCAESDGAFDITMGAVCSLWDFKNGVVPTAAQLTEARRHVGFRTVQVVRDAAASPLVRLDDPDAMIDLGGIAKGYIADELAAEFRMRGIGSGIINLGGNVVTLGTKADGTPWQVGIKDPRNPAQVAIALPARDLSVVTSGLYERCFVSDGIFYHHILDANTGRPVETDLASATVISRCSLDGDGYSTTLFMLGMEGALRFLDAHDAIEGLLIGKDGSIRTSGGLKLMTESAAEHADSADAGSHP
jgi:FAD:protein FMN transferase